MKHACLFSCLFVLSGVLSSNTNASYQVTTPPPAEMVYRDCATTFNDPVLWNDGLPDTKAWSPVCWSVVYYEAGKWHLDEKAVGESKIREIHDRILRRQLERQKEYWADIKLKEKLAKAREDRARRCHTVFSDLALWNAGQPQAKDWSSDCWKFVEKRGGKWFWK